MLPRLGLSFLEPHEGIYGSADLRFQLVLRDKEASAVHRCYTLEMARLSYPAGG